MALSRRQVMQGAAATVLGTSSRGVVLVHGAWHGGWCWDDVRSALPGAVAPTLSGLSDRARELSFDVTLDTHVADVVAAARRFERVTLVGHSYGGLVLSHALRSLGEKIERLIYLDAFVADDGQSGFDLLKPEYVKHWKERAAGGPGVPPMLSAKAMGVTDEKRAREIDAKLTAQPIGTFEQKVQLDAAAFAKVKKTFIRCTKFSGFAGHEKKARGLGFEMKSLDCGHDAMLIAPEALSSLIAGG